MWGGGGKVEGMEEGVGGGGGKVEEMEEVVGRWRKGRGNGGGCGEVEGRMRREVEV